MIVLEFFVIFLYFCVVALTSVTLYLIQQNQQLAIAYRESVDKHQSEIHEEMFESSTEASEAEAEEETYTMTENPMLRRRIPNPEESPIPAVEQVD